MTRTPLTRRLVVAIAALALPVAAAAPAAAAGGGNVSVIWQVPLAPGSGLTNLTFPITVNPATDHQYGLFFAEQFSFRTSGMVGYTGLQPQPDAAPRRRAAAGPVLDLRRGHLQHRPELHPRR